VHCKLQSLDVSNNLAGRFSVAPAEIAYTATRAFFYNQTSYPVFIQHCAKSTRAS